MTVAFFRQADGSYLKQEISKPLNPDTKLPIASLSKSMAATLILDAIKDGRLKPEQMIKIYPESKDLRDSDFSTKGLRKEWTEIPVHAALTQLLKLSSNPMAMNFAITLAGSSEKFVELMNARAKEWQMKNTNFMTEHGLPISDNKEKRKLEYTTAGDMIIMAQHMLAYIDDLKTYTNAPLAYWEPPPPNPRNPKPKPDENKAQLIAEGAIIKTATITQCESLLTIHPEGNVIISDIQLCVRKYSRFRNALTTLRRAFGEIMSAPIPNAIAAPQSSPQGQPSPQ